MENNKKYKIVPLGGVGEIGKNMMVFEGESEIIIIDAGMMFPEDYMAGIDFVIPDFSYLSKKKDRIKGIVLTHGHEDHIGALPYLFRLKEHSLYKNAKLIEINPRDILKFNDFSLEFFQVSHSIADCLGIAIKTEWGIIIHTGDFKVDYTPVNDEYIDFYKLANYGEKGVLLLMSDSTNVEIKGYTPSETNLRESLLKAITTAPGMVLVATFASNIYRIQQILDVCKNIGKKVAILGKSMEENIAMARRLGYIDYPQSIIVSPKKITEAKRKNVLVLTTGSQGEPMSMLTRIANDSYPYISVKEGDTVILSASIIPGNEKTVTRIINRLYKKGAYVYYEGYEDLHVSGHAAQEELKLMFALTKPEYFMPIHGEFRHLVHHAALAKSMGIPKDKILVVEDGNIVRISDGKVKIDGRVDVDNVYIDGKNIGGIEEDVLTTRYRLAQNGIITIVIPISIENHEIFNPEVISRGFVNYKNTELLEKGKSLVFNIVREHIKQYGYQNLNWENIRNKVRKELKKFLSKEIGESPLIVPVIIEV